MSKCNTTKHTQMIYEMFVVTRNLFLCHASNYFGRNLILDICCNFHHFCLKAIIQLHVLQRGSRTFNKCLIQVLSSISFCFVMYGVVVYFICHYLCKTHWFFGTILSTSITLNHLDFLSNFIFHQKFENLWIYQT